MKKKYINVIIYCRVSSDEQKNNTSLDFQEEQLREYCKRMGYNVIAVNKSLLKEYQTSYGRTGAYSTGNGGKYAYYNCCFCKQVKSRAEKANERFVEFIATFRPTPEAQEVFELIVKDLTEKGKEERKTECENIQTQISSIDGKIAVADDKMLDGVLDMEQYQRIVERLKSEKQKLTERFETLKRPRDTKLEPKLTYAYSLIDSMVRYIREAPVEVRCHLIGSIFP